MPDNPEIAKKNQVGQLLRGAKSQPLSPEIQKALKRNLGSRASGIREVYTGPAATNACKALGARAFVMGDAIVVSDGIPVNSPASEALFAHELVHQVSRSSTSTTSDDPAEGTAIGIERMILTPGSRPSNGSNRK